MRLDQLPRISGDRRGRKRLGRGRGSGHGKTSGRGHKGQNSRAGRSVRPGFESGHVPLYRRLPQRGFNNANFKVEYAVVNVGCLSKINRVKNIDRDTLIKAGLIRKNAKLVKILGYGEVDRAFNVKADQFSGSATEKIKAAGGKVVELGKAPDSAEESVGE
ncbi:MAG: 50S ribosomal protein L15 [Candidatus Moanabacter tarae]|uniref:Large ribosomal subunit protein uL15 n=1 Tax=Candidatus Moanibacter tarae TaxID=2200854 RepID=A0A2Z4AEI4_9BACT|nr:MAG: 50S ribosomal protein L15 [Candidatus Moanabacter tarae]